jgi:hypothetical protein
MYMRLFQIQVHRDAEDARGESISGESVRGPEPRGVQGSAPILQKHLACGHKHA